MIDKAIETIQDNAQASIISLVANDDPDTAEVCIHASYAEAIALLAHAIWSVREEMDGVTLEDIGKDLNTAVAMMEEDALEEGAL